MRLKAAARDQRCDYLTWNDIQACVDQVNFTVQEEHERKIPRQRDLFPQVVANLRLLNWNSTLLTCAFAVSGIAAIGQINEALQEGDSVKTLAMLQNPAAKLTDVDQSVAQHYHDKLLEARREKAHVRGVL